MVLNHHIRRYSAQKSLFSFRVQQVFIFLRLRLICVIFWLYLRFRLCFKEELVTVSMYFLKALMSGWFLYVRMTLKVGCGIFSDDTEAATRGILREKVFLEISQNSQENTCEFCEISKNTFSYRAPLVAVSFVVKVVSINQFNVNVLFLYHLKTLENLRFSDLFRGYRNGEMVWNVLRIFVHALREIYSLFCFFF